MWPQNAFLTLTYDAQHVPTSYSLDLRHWQLFMKKLRKSLPQKIRFFACGEYGDENGRPHYHAIIFNHQFSDLKLYSIKRGKKLFTSTILSNLWEMGHATTGSVEPESTSYVARYCTKKINGDLAPNHYHRVSPIDGQTYNVKPEFAVMSRRPGIGATWLDKFKPDVFPSGTVVVNGRIQPTPRYYINRLEEAEQEQLKKDARYRKRHPERKWNNTLERRRIRKAVRDARITKLKREL